MNQHCFEFRGRLDCSQSSSMEPGQAHSAPKACGNTEELAGAGVPVLARQAAIGRPDQCRRSVAAQCSRRTELIIRIRQCSRGSRTEIQLDWLAPPTISTSKEFRRSRSRTAGRLAIPLGLAGDGPPGRCTIPLRLSWRFQPGGLGSELDSIDPARPRCGARASLTSSSMEGHRHCSHSCSAQAAS